MSYDFLLLEFLAHVCYIECQFLPRLWTLSWSLEDRDCVFIQHPLIQSLIQQIFTKCFYCDRQSARHQGCKTQCGDYEGHVLGNSINWIINYTNNWVIPNTVLWKSISISSFMEDKELWGYWWTVKGKDGSGSKISLFWRNKVIGDNKRRLSLWKVRFEGEEKGEMTITET